MGPEAHGARDGRDPAADQALAPLRVRGLDVFPAGGALVVSNHSGGMFAMDVPVFATGFYERFGFDRPIFTLTFDLVLSGPTGAFFRKTGFIKANHENADEALRSGGVVVVPGRRL